jgi:hypothetical protein
MLKETKIGNAVIVTQTTYYLYRSEEDRENDNYFMCTSDKKTIDMYKKQLRAQLKKNKTNEVENIR